MALNPDYPGWAGIRNTRETMREYSTLGITITVIPIPSNSNHYPLLNGSLGSMCKSFISLSTTLFPSFPGPTSSSGSLDLRSYTQSLSSFLKTLKHVLTTAVCFFVTLLLCLLFLTPALIQCKVLISPHISI